MAGTVYPAGPSQLRALHALRSGGEQRAGTLPPLLQGSLDRTEPDMLVRVLAAAAVAVSTLAAAIPTPKSHFGHEIGADRTVLDWARVVSYFRALEKASPRIHVEELGKTTMG